MHRLREARPFLRPGFLFFFGEGLTLGGGVWYNGGMSVAALQFYDLLLSHGMKDAAARALAEAAENELARNRQQAEEYTDKAVAVVVEKSDAKFVSKEQMGEMLTRGEFLAAIGELRREMNDRFAAQHAEIRQLYRVIIGLIVAILGVGASWVWVSLRIAGVL